MHLNLLDLLNLLFLPLAVLTIIRLRKQWGFIFDAHFSLNDRFWLQRLVIFVLLPLVVLCHELGHALAIILFKGKVLEFHYGFFWGYVVPQGIFTPEQLVWIYLAGNLVGVIIGLLSLVLAFFVSSPPVVALLVYLALWSIGQTVVLYPLISLSGLYGDWIAIYTAPVHRLKIMIAAVHFCLVAATVWAVYGQKPRMWFARKTCPWWADEQKKLQGQVKASHQPEDSLNLGWSYLQGGFPAQALSCLKAAGDHPGRFALEGALALNQSNLNKASACFGEALKHSELNSRQQARALIGLSDCLSKGNHSQEALQCLEKACLVDPEIADPHLLKAIIFKNNNQLDLASAELQELPSRIWLDYNLAELVDELKQAIL